MSVISILQECYKNMSKSNISTGIQIATNENYGWQVSIDLFDTVYECKDFKDIYIKVSDKNWIKCEKENQIFKGYGGIENLEDILNIFYNWITA
jgi:hypothetical protein